MQTNNDSSERYCDELKRIRQDLTGAYRLDQLLSIQCSEQIVRDLASEIMQLVCDPDLELSRIAAATLSAAKESACPYFIQLLKHSTPYVREHAAFGLRFIGPKAASATAALVSCLQKDPISKVRSEAAAALGAIHAEPDIVVPALIVALGDRALKVVDASLLSLACYGFKAQIAAPRIKELIQEKWKTSTGRVWIARHVLYALNRAKGEIDASVL